MKIELTKDLPISQEEGATEGRQFEVLEVRGTKRYPLYMFIGDTGTECVAWKTECVVINE